jgi:excisionase family DNA binding protein
MTDDRLLTPPQVAERLQVNERTVTQWLRKGHLRGFKIGKEWRVSAADLGTFLEASANKPPDKPCSAA